MLSSLRFIRLFRSVLSSLSRRAGMQLWCALFLLTCALSATPPSLHAQGGMGGRGGGMGGRGGGMGGRGGGMGGGGMRSPADMAKKNLKASDQITFYLDHKKPLALTSSQRDTLKSLQKEMRHMQEPLFKDMEKLTSDMPQRGRGGRGGMGRGEGRGEGRGDDGDERGEGRGEGRGGFPDTLRALVARLTDIQDAYRDRARTQLTATQVSMADSLFSAKLAEERRKDEEAREKRRRP